MNTYNITLDYIVFSNESTKYIVAKVTDLDTGSHLTITGNMLSYKKGAKYCITGSEVVHPKYGKQIKMVSYEEILASDEEDVVNYLSSSLFKGIGKVMAQRIVDTLGENCLQLIMEDKDNLKGIKGLSEEKINSIYNTLIDDNKDTKTLQYLMKYHFSINMIDKLISTYKEDTLEMMQKHPYATISEIEGLSFRMVDQYALEIGYDNEDEERIEALITYVISEYCFQNGHTYISEDQLFILLNKYDASISYEAGLNHLIEQKKVIVRNGDYILSVFDHSEQGIVNGLLGYINEELEEVPEDLDEEIERVESRLNIEYSSSQKEAIHEFIAYPFMLLTGGPGTGKTTLVKACIEVYKSMNDHKEILLCAPTGRAAKRLSELTGIEASTIHRLLKWDMTKNEFGVNDENPLVCDLLIIDEFSMVDTFLFYNLIKACRNVKKILILGDDEQLPSVMPGQLLHDLLQVESIHHKELTEIYRQKSDSGIITLAHKIRNQDEIDYTIFNEYNDIYFYNTRSISQTIEKLILKAISQGYTTSDIQILAPMYRGSNGIDALNQYLQNLLNPADRYKKEIKVGNKIYREGDKILQLKNRIDDNIFNGDIGEIIEITPKGKEYSSDTIVVDYDGILVEYTNVDFIEITHAYCMSIHKAQGSEFKIVIMVLTMDFYPMLQKKLIYTGLTRAKSSLFILGDYQAFDIGIHNEYERVRHTYLKERFMEDAPDHYATPYDFMEENGDRMVFEEDDLDPYSFM